MCGGLLDVVLVHCDPRVVSHRAGQHISAAARERVQPSALALCAHERVRGRAELVEIAVAHEIASEDGEQVGERSGEAVEEREQQVEDEGQVARGNLRRTEEQATSLLGILCV